MDLENRELLNPIIKGCRKWERAAQKELYKAFFRYGMSICLKFSKNEEEAKEILNDAFIKIFSKLDLYRPEHSFKSWARRIFINASIDYYRKNHKYSNVIDIAEAPLSTIRVEASDNLEKDDILKLVQSLPPSYRIVFTLYVLEGYKHHEVAEMLDISVGASKSNLAKAKSKLRTMIQSENNYYNEKFG